mmetsp:Transcript_468/g.1137  ORF Transcript_468/g.1137 Transcript_468/m.1137 type:complete len:1018 (+) Transcript_468:489-3542(+)|eukprot:CAMPEP_0171567178 /NCGR_PEP_ID=MMETSP0961-20121227/1010_1 /TAXON_ID=87120 /ORGANISM="Aurantiochytrium limacinum, Strain ATCCMYA-1381" /LENGTH=1017 /DNA_ID=CAMNT_0012121059 /DNA_START=394 /DNA_END=3447 /DNA_ORIENTATION=-
MATDLCAALPQDEELQDWNSTSSIAAKSTLGAIPSDIEKSKCNTSEGTPEGPGEDEVKMDESSSFDVNKKEIVENDDERRHYELSIVEKLFEQTGANSTEVVERGLEESGTSKLRGGFVAISVSWWTKWTQWSGFGRVVLHRGSSLRPGPLELGGGGTGCTLGSELLDYAWVPEEVWRAFATWYPSVKSHTEEKPVLYRCTGPPGSLSPAQSNGRGRASTNLRSSSIYEAFDLPKDPSYWDAHWSNLASCHRAPGPKGDLQCTACCKSGATQVCGKCRKTRYCSRDCQASAWRFHQQRCGTAGPEEQRRGLIGLKNLGNTCYMNATLQCLSHCWPLTRFFLSNKFKQDRNEESVLGTGARFAMIWDSLIKELWFGSKASISPGPMKRAIGTLPGSGGQFAGFMQQDAQELLIFLLDTLHEDLNLVKSKPYFAEVDNMSDPPRSIADLAGESWAKHLRREHSMITHLFQGQLHNTVSCPHCHFQSHTFTPFMILPLAIPVDRDRIVIVTMIRQFINHDGFLELSRTRYAVSVRPSARCAQLKMQLAEMCGVPPGQQFMLQLRNHVVVREFVDSDPVNSIAQSCDLHVYEIPSQDVLEKIFSFSSNASCLRSTAPSDDSKMEDVEENPTREIFILHKQGASIDSNMIGMPLLLIVSAKLTLLEVRMAIYKLLRVVTTGREEKDINVLKREGKALELRFTDHLGKIVNMEGLERALSSSAAMSTSNAGTPVKSNSTVGTQAHGLGSDEKEGEIKDSDNAQQVLQGVTDLSSFPSHSDLTLEECISKPFFFLSVIWGDGTPVRKQTKARKSKKARQQSSASGSRHKQAYSEGANLETTDHVSVASYLSSMRARAAAQRGHLQGEVYTLHECLEYFSNSERLGTGNAWSCPKCKTNQEADKMMRIIRLPEILIFCLKRFEHRGYGKISSLVDFPLETLEMGPFLAEFGGDKEKEDPIFDLFAVTNHIGSSGMGHYTAYVARQDTPSSPASWYLCDDSRVTPMDPSMVVSSYAYCLYYKRRRH